MAAGFVHLHLHSSYSLLDGAVRIRELIPAAQELGMNALAITDHGNMFGAVDFYQQARKAGIKPIIGCEAYVAPADRFDRTLRGAYHLILLARNNEGYKNLIYLVSKANLEGFYYRPRVDKALLRDRTAGLIGMSACLGGEIPRAFREGGPERAKKVAAEYRDLFEPGCFYLEIQNNGYPEQAALNVALRSIGTELGIPLAATNDVHYLRASDAQAHEILMCIQSGHALNDPKRNKMHSDELYLRSEAEMIAALPEFRDAIERTREIADACDVTLDLKSTYLPDYIVPEGETYETYLRKLAFEGLEKRFAEARALGLELDEPHYRERVEMELKTIVAMGFPGYFLIVWDFINEAKRRGVPVGPGRGSGAGSAVAWAIRITELDPVRYGLLFERFLNPERVSMPDFDVDFCKNRRDEVIKYVVEKYGQDRVGQIATFHQLKTRSVTRDVGRAMGMPYGDVDKIAKLLPEPGPGTAKITIGQAIKADPRLKEQYDKDPAVRRLLDFAERLEGLHRHVGVHAGGVVIGKHPLWEHVPVFGQPGEMVTEYDKDFAEQCGLVKFDFLGLKTMTILDIAVGLINKRPDHQAPGVEPLDLLKLPLDDRATYELITAGDATCVFQMESKGFRDLIRRLAPDRFEEIVALLALYRPGPLEGGMVDDFVERKHGRQKITYLHESLEPVLKETYGIIVYQEQVMQCARVLAGFTLGAADIMRRAMGKKKAEVMAEQRRKFVAGCATNGIDEDKADEIFDLIDKFAGYGFNKCVVSGTIVTDASTGERTTVGDLFCNRRPFAIHALDQHGKLVPRDVSDVVWNGAKPVFRLTTTLGHVITATANHPFRTLDGWTNLGDLRPGDQVLSASASFAGWDADTVWDRVESIESAGVEDTYDLTVDGDHNFVADGLIVHNSHSAAYALVSYHTAYLKAHFPVEFLAANLTCDSDDTDRIAYLVSEARAKGMKILPPDINESDTSFAVTYDKETGEAAAIRFGLGALKGVGESGLEAVFEARRDGPFRDLYDFCGRVDLHRVNRAMLEALVKGGAFDGLGAALGVDRARTFAAIDTAIERGKASQHDRECGQGSLFDLLAEDEQPTAAQVATAEYPQGESWDLQRLLLAEREALGFYLTGHPLDRYRAEIQALSDVEVRDLGSRIGKKVRLCGIVEGYREKPLKSGTGRVAFFQLEDLTGRIEVFVSSKIFATASPILQRTDPIVAECFVQLDQNGEEEAPRLRLESAVALRDWRQQRYTQVHLTLTADRITHQQIATIRDIFSRHPGRCMAYIRFSRPGAWETVLALPDRFRVDPSDEMVSELESALGPTRLDFRC